MGPVLEHVAMLEDPRGERARRHPLLSVVMLALCGGCGVICGAESWVEIEPFGQAKAEWFASFLDLPRGIPSRTWYDTFGRVFAHLDAAQFEACTERVVAWPGLRAIGLVEAECHWPDGHSEREARYYLLSTPLTAQQFAEAVRAHWGLENQGHWRLDVALHEDDSRVRRGDGAERFAVLRRVALHLLKQETTATCGIKAKRLKAGWSHDYLLKVLAG